MTPAKIFVVAALVSACGSSSPAKKDAAVDSPAGGAAKLTVKNYLSWCSVAVNGGTASSGPSQQVDITASGAMTLVATPASASFMVGGNMWHHTDGDTGAGETGTVSGSMSTATVTVTAGTAKCVWVCCPFTNGTGCTGLADQCP